MNNIQKRSNFGVNIEASGVVQHNLHTVLTWALVLQLMQQAESGPVRKAPSRQTHVQ
jgi:hypothetical protein